MATPQRTADKPKKAASSVVTTYLVVFNALSWLGWSYVLFLTLKHWYETGDYAGKNLYPVIGSTLLWVQTAALGEVLHAILGLVKTPVATTAIQVASRLFLVWGIVNQYDIPEVRTHWLYTTMTIAWSVTEVIRYAFYALNLLGIQSELLLWARYTFFLVLYPMGASSEAGLIFQSLGEAEKQSIAIYYLYIALLVIYPPGLYVMYSHMLRQRKSALRLSKDKKHA